MTIQKRVPFKTVKIRKIKLRLEWHTFECLDCGRQTREYSDPRASLFLCHDCLARRWGITKSVAIMPPQVDTPGDWWTAFCIEYQSKLSLGLIDRYGKDIQK